MSKELTPLEALDEIIDDFIIVQDALDTIDKTSQRDKDYFKQWLNERKNIIETTLKKYEELTNKHITLYSRTHGRTQALIDLIGKNYKEVKVTNLEDRKKLKALEIIKETPEFAWYVKIYENAYEMIADRKSFRLDESAEELQKKFDLLKEVLL